MVHMHFALPSIFKYKAAINKQEVLMELSFDIVKFHRIIRNRPETWSMTHCDIFKPELTMNIISFQINRFTKLNLIMTLQIPIGSLCRFWLASSTTNIDPPTSKFLLLR